LKPAAVVGVTRRIQTLSDGTCRVVIDFEPDDLLEVVQSFGAPGTAVAVARLSDPAALSAAQSHRFGNEAQALRQSGFFRRPAVWRLVGDDCEYLSWLRLQKCCVKGGGHGGDVQAAHVRRVAAGAGTGVKPEYSAVPMCAIHHDEQHRKGESAVGGREFLEEQAVKHVEEWAWHMLKATLGFSHWYEVPPEILAEWAMERDVFHFLPECYREALGEQV